MADTIDNQVVAPEAPVVDPVKAELDQMMNFALNAANVPRETISTTTAPETVPEPVVTSTEPPVFTFDTLKEKFGFQNPDEVLAEIEQLRAYKAAPPVAEVEFENENSKKLFELLRTGKTKEVSTFLAQQERLSDLLSSEVTKDTAPEIVKQGMQLKYKDLTPAEIDYKFKKQFSIPPKPTQSSDEDSDDYKAKVDAWQEVVNDKQMELMIEAKLARPELEQFKSNLVFPEIDQPADPEYLNYKKAVEENSKLAAEAVTAYKAMTPDSIATKVPFVDEANGVKFDFDYKPDPASYSQALDMVTDIEKFYDQFQKPDGSPDRNKFFRTIHNAINMDKILKEAMTQAKNATLRSILPDNTQATGLVRQLNSPVEQSDLDRMMAERGIRR